MLISIGKESMNRNQWIFTIEQLNLGHPDEIDFFEIEIDEINVVRMGVNYKIK